MTRTEERLTDALAATADSVHEDTLRPLVPPASRRRRHVAWMAPVAAMAGVLLVVGLAVAGQLADTGQRTVPAAGGVPRYYVAVNPTGEALVVRSVATGTVTATVPYPAGGDLSDGLPVVASARHGVFFAATYRGKSVAEQIYRFQVTGTGQASGLAPVPDAVMPHGWAIDAIAASPDGSQLAVGVTEANSGTGADQIIVIHTETGAKTVWNGAMSRLGNDFSVGSLSWTADGRELAVLGQWLCPDDFGNENCHTPSKDGRNAEVWALNPASGGGQLSSGHLLLRQSNRNPDVVQAVISQDGSIITAVVLTRRVVHSGRPATTAPGSLQVRQISVATGKQLRVLYRRQLPAVATDPARSNSISLSPDSSGQYWMLSAILGINPAEAPAPVQFSGWIRDQKVTPLQPSWGNVNSAAW